MSRLDVSQPGRQTGQSSLAAEQTKFDLRLARSFVAFANGQAAESAFEWVSGEQRRICQLAGIEYDPPTVKDVDTDALRPRAKICVWLLALPAWDLPGLRSKDRASFIETFVNMQLKPLQIVSLWRMAPHGGIEETHIPRLNTLARCVAYAIGLMLLDRHSLRRGIKPCLFSTVRDAPLAIVPIVTAHLFLDLPNSKRKYCCIKHAEADRKRRQRAAPKRRQARKPK